MPITAQSADGVLHQFPDQTDPAVIDRTMKNYTLSRPQTAAPGKTDLLLHGRKSMPGDADQILEGLRLFTDKATLN